MWLQPLNFSLLWGSTFHPWSLNSIQFWNQKKAFGSLKVEWLRWCQTIGQMSSEIFSILYHFAHLSTAAISKETHLHLFKYDLFIKVIIVLLCNTYLDLHKLYLKCMFMFLAASIVFKRINVLSICIYIYRLYGFVYYVYSTCLRRFLRICFWCGYRAPSLI